MYSLGSKVLVLVVVSCLCNNTGSLGVLITSSATKFGLMAGTRTSVLSCPPTVNCTMLRPRFSKSPSSPLSSRQTRTRVAPPSLLSSPVSRSTLSLWRLGLPVPLHWDSDSESFLFLFCWEAENTEGYYCWHFSNQYNISGFVSA